MTTNGQIYILGQIYGKLCGLDKNLATPEGFGRACKRPMREITAMIMKLRQSRKLTAEVDEYIGLRFDDIDSENEEIMGDSVLPIELQGTFQIGYFHAQKQKNQKELIKKTGLSQQEIAGKLGVAANTVSRWTLEQSKISEKTRYELEKLSLDL